MSFFLIPCRWIIRMSANKLCDYSIIFFSSISTWFICSNERPKNHTKTNKSNNILLDTKEKIKKMHIKSRSHKYTNTSVSVNTKENTYHGEAVSHSNRILSRISNNIHQNQNHLNGSTKNAKFLKTVDKNAIKTIDSENGAHDSRTIVQKLNEYRKSTR